MRSSRLAVSDGCCQRLGGLSQLCGIWVCRRGGGRMFELCFGRFSRTSLSRSSYELNMLMWKKGLLDRPYTGIENGACVPWSCSDIALRAGIVWKEATVLVERAREVRRGANVRARNDMVVGDLRRTTRSLNETET